MRREGIDLKSQAGFSMIMVLVAMAIVGLLSLAVAAVASSVQANMRHFDSLNGRRNLSAMLQSFLEYPQLCTQNLSPTTQTFSGTTAISGPGLPLAFYMGSKNLLVADGQPLLPFDVMTEYLRFKATAPLTSLGNDPTTPGNVLYSGTLFLKLKKTASGDDVAAGGNYMRERIIGTLVLSVNPVNSKISGCYGVFDNQAACEGMGGIYSATGTPKCKLPYPCQNYPNTVFMGYDAATGSPQCKTVGNLVGSNCPANTYLVSDGSGNATCQSPPTL